MDTEIGWRLSPRVSVRPEPFGALLYHFGTRKLSFLKDRTLLAIVEQLEGSPTPLDACDAAGVQPADRDRYLTALGVLAESAMIEKRAA